MAIEDITLITGLAPAAETTHPFLTANAPARSLNRARLMELPSLPVEEEILGWTAYDLVSANAVIELVRQSTLGLDFRLPPPLYLRAFNESFLDTRKRPVAENLAAIFGRRLGAILLMLVRGDTANRAARPEWDDAHWDYWRTIERVMIGGGLLAGELGRVTLAETRRFLNEAGSNLAVERSPYGASLALVGLARYAPPDTRHMLVFDFGQTNVKSGLAIYHNGALTRVAINPPDSASCAGPDFDLAAAREQWASMRALIESHWQAAIKPAERSQTTLGLALATHLHDGHPFETDRGCYGRLQLLAPHLATFLRDDLAGRLGQFLSFALLHDGLAAAASYAGKANTVVLTLGTAIGAGYVPPDRGLRSFAEGFAVDTRGT